MHRLHPRQLRPSHVLSAGTPLKVNVLARDLVAAMLEKQRQREAELQQWGAVPPQQPQQGTAGPASSEAATGPVAGGSCAISPLPSLQQAAIGGARSLEQQLAAAAGAAGEQSAAAAGSDQDAAAGDVPGSTSLSAQHGQQPPPAMHSLQQQQAAGSPAPSSPVAPQPRRPRGAPKPLPQAALHFVAEAVVVAAQLLIWAFAAESAGRLRSAAWLAAAVALPPALAVWGRLALLTLALAAAAVALAAARQWRALAVLLAAAVAADVVAGLSLGRVQPQRAPWV